MQTEFLPMSDDLKQMFIDKSNEEYAKIYGNVDLSNKIFLIVTSEFFFPYSDDVTGEISFYGEKEVNDKPLFVIPTKITKPHPNKGIRQLSA
jgi:hypothetical protein